MKNNPYRLITKEEMGIEMKKRWMSGKHKDYEIVVALFAMRKAGRITNEDIKEMLYVIFGQNEKQILRVVSLAQYIADDEMLDEITNEQ